MSEWVVNVDRVYKKFARSIKRAMWYGTVDIARAALLPHRYRSERLEARVADARAAGHDAPPVPAPIEVPPLRPTEFWALHDVSVKLKQGDSLGLLGANGAGKSTLFSILSGIYGPTCGTASYRGRLQALIALGAGFHPSLSGRENVYINAAILGLREKEVDRIFDHILEFSEIGAFIDAPIKTYSSGMLVRLAFSVAIHLDPDILLIDEVLAVGDAAFVIKCARFSRSLINSGKTLVLVSHNMLMIQMMCQRAIWLDHGKIVQDGDTQTVGQAYQRFMLMKVANSTASKDDKAARFGALIETCAWRDADGRPVDKVVSGKPHFLDIVIQAVAEIPCARLWVQINGVGQEATVMAASMFETGHYLALKPGRNVVSVRWENVQLARGVPFQVTAGLRDWSGAIMVADSFASAVFDAARDEPFYLGVLGDAKRIEGTVNPLLLVPYEWAVTDEGSLRADASLGV